MRHKIFVLLIMCISMVAKSQDSYTRIGLTDFVPETAVSAGFGMGGGTVMGGEMEVMFFPRVSAQLGAGFFGFSGGLNYHIYPTVSSPYFSLKLWQDGLGNDYDATYIGPSFVYRAGRLFQAGLGFGYLVNKNPAYKPGSNFTLSFNLGLYFPL